MSKTITITFREDEAKRLHDGHWKISVGDGVMVPLTIQRAEARIRWALASAFAEEADA